MALSLGHVPIPPFLVPALMKGVGPKTLSLWHMPPSAPSPTPVQALMKGVAQGQSVWGTCPSCTLSHPISDERGGVRNSQAAKERGWRTGNEAGSNGLQLLTHIVRSSQCAVKIRGRHFSSGEEPVHLGGRRSGTIKEPIRINDRYKKNCVQSIVTDCVVTRGGGKSLTSGSFFGLLLWLAPSSSSEDLRRFPRPAGTNQSPLYSDKRNAKD